MDRSGKTARLSAHTEGHTQAASYSLWEKGTLSMIGAGHRDRARPDDRRFGRYADIFFLPPHRASMPRHAVTAASGDMLQRSQ